MEPEPNQEQKLIRRRLPSTPPPSPILSYRTMTDTNMDTGTKKNTMDLSALSHALPSLSSFHSSSHSPILFRNPTFHCAECALPYYPKWFHVGHSRCFFCMRFRSPNVTRYALLYETQWYFIQSGEDDSYAYYTEYMELLHRWADTKKLPLTQREYEYQLYLLSSVSEK